VSSAVPSPRGVDWDAEVIVDASSRGEARLSVAAPSDETGRAERVIATGFALARTGTLLLGAGKLVTSGPGTDQALGAAALAVVGLSSAAVLARGVFRSRPRRSLPPLDGCSALTEVLAGVGGLVLLATATPVRDRLGPEFWMLPCTVVSSVLVAAACRRILPGLLGSLILMGGYIVALAPVLRLGSAAGSGATAIVLDNALSYPGFFVLSLIGFRLYRFIAGEVEKLRRLATNNRAERARLEAASRAYRIGHDIPKAYLRELRRAELPSDRLRLWADRFRGDLLCSLSVDPRVPVELPSELANIAGTFADGIPFTVDMSNLGGPLVGVPVLIMTEAVRECLNNASYHAFGSPVTVTAASTESVLAITVSDAGPGCEPEQVITAWERKNNAVHQVEVAGGSYQVVSRPGGGTIVRLSFPLACP